MTLTVVDDARPRRDLRYPIHGAWPALMHADMAAAYVDEPDRDAFLRKVRARVYPLPVRLPNCRARWRRADLDATITGQAVVVTSLDGDL
jgi:hypothetical protein